MHSAPTSSDDRAAVVGLLPRRDRVVGAQYRVAAGEACQPWHGRSTVNQPGVTPQFGAACTGMGARQRMLSGGGGPVFVVSGLGVYPFLPHRPDRPSAAHPLDHYGERIPAWWMNVGVGEAPRQLDEKFQGLLAARRQ